MEWIQRNPKKAVGLSVLALLVVTVLVVGMSGSSKPAKDPTLGAPLATPTATPTHILPVLPAPSESAVAAGASSLSQLNTIMGASSTGDVGNGYSASLKPHEVVIEAGAEGGLAALAWRIPHAKGTTEGQQTDPGSSWTLAKTEYGLPAYTGFYTYVGETRGRLWCTIKVDGKVVVHEEARGPWGQVYCGI